MRNNARLNGCDYLMLGFDHELRRAGFAGNSCQIVLEIGSAISLPQSPRRANVVTSDATLLVALMPGTPRLVT